MVGLGRIGPAPGVGEGVEFRLAGCPRRFAEQDVVVGVGIKGGIEVNEVDAGVRGILSCPGATGGCRQSRGGSSAALSLADAPLAGKRFPYLPRGTRKRGLSATKRVGLTDFWRTVTVVSPGWA